MKDSSELVLAARAIRAAAAPTEHPTAEELVAFGGGELDADVMDRVRRHLVTCRECAALVLDFDLLRRGELGAGAPASEFERAAAWRAVRGALRGAAAPVRGAVSPWWKSLAAAFAGLALGLGIWGASLGPGVRVNPQILDLAASASRSVGDPTIRDRVRTVVLGPEDRTVTFALQPPYEVGEESWDLVLYDPEGEELWSGEGTRNDLDSVVIEVERRVIDDTGEYKVVLVPTGGGESLEFTFVVELPAEEE